MDAATPHDLGNLVRHRRKVLHFSQPEAATRGGLSEATLRRIEQGKMANLRNSTRAGLERALDWRHGTVNSIIDGAVDPVDLETRWVAAGPDGRQIQVGDRGQKAGGSSLRGGGSGVMTVVNIADTVGITDDPRAAADPDVVALARATRQIEQAIADLAGCEQTPRVVTAISGLARLRRLTLAEQVTPGDDV